MSSARPIVFGPPGARVSGVLVTPPGAAAARADAIAGVVICDPFGIEALAADRSLNHLVAALARDGQVVLRFSPPGLGDSEELPDGESIVGPWRTAIDAAIDLLTGECGCAHVSLVGLRLGAAMAAAVAADRGDVDRLVLWAPVAGRPFVREMKLLGAGAGTSGPIEADDIATRFAVEAGGYGLSDASAGELASVDPSKLTRRPAADVLIVDRDDLRSAGKLAAHFVTLGAAVDVPELPGFAAMRLDDPESGEVPFDAISAMASWIARSPTVEVSHEQRTVAPRAPHAPTDLVLEVEGTRIVENAVRIPVKDGRELHAIVTRPLAPAHAQLGLLQLTTGSNPACGAGRLHTRLARHWAANGHVVLRIDRRGVGVTELWELLDASGPATPTVPPDTMAAANGGAAANHDGDGDGDGDGSAGGLGEAYAEIHVDDVAAVEQYMRMELGAERVVLVGMCSGAYTAYRTARAERPGSGIHALIALNQIIFDDHAWTTQGESPAYAIKARYELGQALRDPRRWIDLVRGDVPIIPTVRRLVHFARLRVGASSKRIAARLRGRPAPAVGVSADLQAIAAAGIRQTYVFDEAETGLGYLRLHADGPIAAMTADGTLTQHTVSGAGHTFGPEWSKRWLIGTLDRTLADLAR